MAARLGELVLWAPIVTVAAVLVAIGLALARRRWPSRERLGPYHQSLVTDLGYICLSPASNGLTSLVTTLAVVGGAWLLGKQIGPDLLNGFGPIVRQPRWLIVVEMMLLGDLLFYWTHRLAHAWPLLWRLHAIHHSTRHMRATSAMRTHPGEAYAQMVQILPVFLMGFPPDGLEAFFPLSMGYAMFIHSNLKVSFGPLRYVFNSPAYHRWHHALEDSERTTNFAGWFTFYDVLFGTYRLPPEPPAELGIEEPIPETCFGQLAHPFRFRRSSRWSLKPARTS